MLKKFHTGRTTAVYNKAFLQSLLYSFFIFTFSTLFNDSVSAIARDAGSGKKGDPVNKELLNGRIWWNQYSKAIGNQYFLDGSYMRGSVVFNGKRYTDLDLKYDIANDELLFNLENHPVILLNKEMVDSFTLVFQNRIYNIFNAGNDTSLVFKGYVNLLYRGPSSLYVKYTKKIYPLAVDGRFDLFAEEHRIFLNTPNGIIPITTRKKFFDILSDKKKEMNRFRRENKLKCSIRNPDSFTPLVEFYDNLKKQGSR
jgi:hypothetical protein